MLEALGTYDRVDVGAVEVVFVLHGGSLKAGCDERALATTRFADVVVYPLYIKQPRLKICLVDHLLVFHQNG